jgi:hypothetical protein
MPSTKIIRRLTAAARNANASAYWGDEYHSASAFMVGKGQRRGSSLCVDWALNQALREAPSLDFEGVSGELGTSKRLSGAKIRR